MKMVWYNENGMEYRYIIMKIVGYKGLTSFSTPRRLHRHEMINKVRRSEITLKYENILG